MFNSQTAFSAQCPICHVEMQYDESCELCCGHSLCASCFGNFPENKGLCPFCKLRITLHTDDFDKTPHDKCRIPRRNLLIDLAGPSPLDFLEQTLADRSLSYDRFMVASILFSAEINCMPPSTNQFDNQVQRIKRRVCFLERSFQQQQQQQKQQQQKIIFFIASAYTICSIILCIFLFW